MGRHTSFSPFGLCCLTSVVFLGVGSCGAAADEPSSVPDLLRAVEKHHREKRPREACAYAERLHAELARQLIEKGVEDISRDLSSGKIDAACKHEAYEDIMAVNKDIAVRVVERYWQSIEDKTDPANIHTRRTVVMIMYEFWDPRTIAFFVPLLDHRDHWISALGALELIADQSFGLNAEMTPEHIAEARNRARIWALKELRGVKYTGFAGRPRFKGKIPDVPADSR